MTKMTISLMAAATLLSFTGCMDGGNAGGEKITYDKTAEEVFTQKCSKCHGDKAQGLAAKKTPPMNDRQAEELELDLYDVKNGGLNQSSGTDHDVMEHNMQKLLEKGYNYDPKEMAEFIEKSFYVNPDAQEAAEEEETEEANATE